MSQTTPSIEQAFKRHSRPQHPTLPVAKPRVLGIQSTPSWVPPPPTTKERRTAKEEFHTATTSRWINFVQLGKIVQGRSELLVCTSREEKSKLFMFKWTGRELDDDSRRSLTLYHPNLMVAKHVITSDVGMHIGYDYVRYTLNEILCVHVQLEEIHIRTIAKAVFSGIKYLNEHGLLHGRVGTNTIRVSGRTGQVLLGDCNECTQLKEHEFVNTDLEDLGLALLECMEEQPRRYARTAAEVREQRATNKVFGLSKPARWSGCKQLVDFLDDLFGAQRRPALKLHRIHEYVSEEIQNEQALYPIVEVASLECFTMWQVVE